MHAVLEGQASLLLLITRRLSETWLWHYQEQHALKGPAWMGPRSRGAPPAPQVNL